MSFTRVKPGGYSVGGKVASGEFNQLDLDHANALDKTGDTITGTIHVGNGATLQFNSGGFLSLAPGSTVGAGGTINLGSGSVTNVVSGGQIRVQFDSGVQAQVADAINSNIAGGIAPGVAGGISDGGIQGGIAVTQAEGITSTAAGGGIYLNGGANDWPILGIGGARAGRAFTLACPIVPRGAPSGWTVTPYGVQGSAGTAPLYGSLRLPTGCTIDSVTLVMSVIRGHSALPEFPPSLTVFTSSLLAGSPFNQPLNQAGTIFASPSSVSNWEDGGQIQHPIVYNCTQNNDGPTGSGIDTSAYTYGFWIIDENGTNAIAGNTYYGVIVEMTVNALRYF